MLDAMVWDVSRLKRDTADDDLKVALTWALRCVSGELGSVDVDVADTMRELVETCWDAMGVEGWTETLHEDERINGLVAEVLSMLRGYGL